MDVGYVEVDAFAAITWWDLEPWCLHRHILFTNAPQHLPCNKTFIAIDCVLKDWCTCLQRPLWGSQSKTSEVAHDGLRGLFARPMDEQGLGTNAPNTPAQNQHAWLANRKIMYTDSQATKKKHSTFGHRHGSNLNLGISMTKAERHALKFDCTCKVHLDRVAK